MSINIKKYTKDQMAKMVEDAAERLESLRSENAETLRRHLGGRMRSWAPQRERLGK